jgi:hypothetical protein
MHGSSARLLRYWGSVVTMRSEAARAGQLERAHGLERAAAEVAGAAR